jgi:hypothetical protein
LRGKPHFRAAQKEKTASRRPFPIYFASGQQPPHSLHCNFIMSTLVNVTL